MSKKVYKLKLNTLPVFIESEDGTEVAYHISQLTGAMADELRAAQAAKVELDKNGDVVAVRDFSGQYTELLCRCLRTADNQLVTRLVLDQWPNELLEDLYEEAVVFTGLKKPETDADTDEKKS